MYFSENPFLDRQRLPQYRRCLVIALLIDERLTHRRHAQSRIRVLLAVPGSINAEGLPIVLLGLRVMTQIVLDLAQAEEIVGDAGMDRSVKRAVRVQCPLI